MENRLAEFGITGLVILAWLFIWSFTLRSVARHHADNAAAQALTNLI